MTQRKSRYFLAFLRPMPALVLAAVLAVLAFQLTASWREKEALKKIVARLKADSRIAQVLVTDVRRDPQTQKTRTTIKFLEYDALERPLEPRYFTFSGNIIQFQSLVVRFQDFYVERGDSVRGRSAYLFLKVFFLDGPGTEEFMIARPGEVPGVYRLEGARGYTAGVQEAFWKEFWAYALDRKAAGRAGIKNAQIEAPGTMFVPGMLYTLRIEHDGGMRIDAEPLPEILKGEVIAIP